MAGIGFELKKLFEKKGIIASLRAYGYAGAISAGPMLLGAFMLLGVMLLCNGFGMAQPQRELAVGMITYSLLFSLLIASFLSMIITRFIADMLFEGKEEAIMPSFYGSSALLLTIGCIGYGIFLAFAGITPLQALLCLMLFGEMLATWNAMHYLNAIKSYRGLLCAFAAAAVVSLLMCFLLLSGGHAAAEAVLLSVCTGYGVMLCWEMVLLHRFFPPGDASPWLFLRWVDRFPSLAFSGLLVNIGLFGHLIIQWLGPIGEQVQGLFYNSPLHDVPALTAFLTILITTVNFVVSVEVSFYPHYRRYCELYQKKGSVGEILKSQEEMLEVLRTQLFYTAIKQLCATALALALGRLVLNWLPLGFTDLMHGYFRTLCIGYGLYAIANTQMLLLLYFTDYRGALWCTGAFALTATGMTALLLPLPRIYYGLGFLIGAAVFYLLSMLRLNWFVRRLPYHILGRQPIVENDRQGLFAHLALLLERKTGGVNKA